MTSTSQRGTGRAMSTFPTGMPREPAAGTVRIAVLSDPHVGGQGDAAWHSRLRYDDAPAILAAAVEAATAGQADVLVALGDLTDLGEHRALRDVCAALSLFPGPVRVVPGNHDRTRDNEAFEAVFDDAAGDMRLAGVDVEDRGVLGLCGVTVRSDDGGLTCEGHPPDTREWPDRLLVVASHYPVLDVTARLAAAGVRDAGLLRNHVTAFDGLDARTGPVLVLNGHLHARLEQTAGAVLQLSVAALVEAPHEVTFVDLGTDLTGAGIEISVYRLPLVVDRGSSRPEPDDLWVASPVLAPSTTSWCWTGDQWVRQATGVQDRPVLCVDWNGTIVDDDERARRVTVAVLDEFGLPSENLATVADFRARFILPLTSFVQSLGVPDYATATVVARWNELMRAADPPELTPGARHLLTWAAEQGLAVHVVSGADPQVVLTDLARLLPDVDVTSVVGNAHPKSTVLEDLTTDGQGVFVGDTTYDIVEGLRAGAVTVGFAADASKAARLAAAGADLVVTDLTEVEELISSRYLNGSSGDRFYA